MDTTPSPNLQDSFLSHIRKKKIPSTVFLISGVKLQGFITNFDAASVLLQREAHVQLVYKHAISTIMPNASIQVADDDFVQDADA